MIHNSIETLYPSLFMTTDTEWTKEENKRFESALAIYEEHDPNRWFKVAAMIPGKTIADVIKQYKELEDDVSDIEAGRMPIPGYLTPSSFTFDLVHGERDFIGYRKRPLGSKGLDQERKKGVPWTEEEHRRFLVGLMKHGKGDWRSISRHYVLTKTPTQVASHAQKYFIRQQLAGVKDKRRPSIHDITTRNLTTDTEAVVVNNGTSSLDHQLNMINAQQQKLLLAYDALHGTNNALDLGSNGIIKQNLYYPKNLVFHMAIARH